MKMIVHTSLSSIGYVIGGGETVLNALRQAVGEDGLVVIPTFTYGRTPFDPHTSSPVIGAVPRIAAFHPDFSRSAHPTHSFALWGSNASALAAAHDAGDAIGPTSPLHHLYAARGWILLLGVDHRSNTSIHLAEFLAEVPYGQAGEALVAAIYGYRNVPIHWRPGCSEAFQRARSVADAIPGFVRGTVGQSTCQLIPVKPFVDAVAKRLERDPDWLLGYCAWCSESRERIFSGRGFRR